MNRKQKIGIVAILAVIFGLLVLPLLIQRMFGVSAIQVLFVVIIFYIALHFVLKRYDLFERFD